MNIIYDDSKWLKYTGWKRKRNNQHLVFSSAWLPERQKALAVDLDGMGIDQILPGWCSSALDFYS